MGSSLSVNHRGVGTQTLDSCVLKALRHALCETWQIDSQLPSRSMTTRNLSPTSRWLPHDPHNFGPITRHDRYSLSR